MKAIRLLVLNDIFTNSNAEFHPLPSLYNMQASKDRYYITAIQNHWPSIVV